MEGKLLPRLTSIYKWGLPPLSAPQGTLQIIRSFAARKGTREKARKKKIKIEVKKVGFIPHNQRGKEQLDLLRKSKRINDSWKQIPVDNVWVAKYNQLKTYNFQEAISCHRETNHPTMYNVPNALVTACIELDMSAEKKNRYMDNFNRIVSLPYPFDHGAERTVIAFAKAEAQQDEARNAGATLAGGFETIKDIQNGRLSLLDFQFSVAHPDILPELVSLRGIMKRKFPNPKSGTLGADLAAMVRKFMTGIQYSVVKDEHELDYAIVETNIGTLDMNSKELEDNFAAILQDLNQVGQKKSSPFITRCFLLCKPSCERLKINFDEFIVGKELSDSSTKNKDNELHETEEKIAASN